MKLVIQPIYLVGREALHVFALPNHQLQVAAGESQSAAHIRGFMEDAQARLADWTFSPTGTEGFAKAEVTAGGISTADLSSRTLMARRVPGLYAIGEAVDVTGWLGGYNFQWAWASGWAAGQAV